MKPGCLTSEKIDKYGKPLKPNMLQQKLSKHLNYKISSHFQVGTSEVNTVLIESCSN